MSARALLVRIDNLPAGAALWRAMGIDAAWSVEAHLLAFQSDVLNGANWQRGGGKGTKPKPIPRPSQAKKASDPDRQQAMVARLVAQQERQQQLAAEQEVAHDVEGR